MAAVSAWYGSNVGTHHKLIEGLAGLDAECGGVAGERTERTFRLTVAYDGTDYFGWQVQPGLRTVQGVLAGAVEAVVGERVLPQGSGRTDTGVHAAGQTVSLTLRAAIPAERLHRALNRRLPSSIRVTALVDAAAEFHARAGVVNKTYEYRIFERRVMGSAAERVCPPEVARFVWDCRWPLATERMEAAAAAMVGTHDFSSFCRDRSGTGRGDWRR